MAVPIQCCHSVFCGEIKLRTGLHVYALVTSSVFIPKVPVHFLER